MGALEIGKGTKVTLHFQLSLENGEVVDSNFDALPPSFIFGDGSLLEGFEKKLIGLVSGDEETFTLLPENAFGLHNVENIQKIPVKSFSGQSDFELGLVISFKEPSGGELPGVVTAFDENAVTVDFNHPLAGHTIVFRVKIISVEPASTH